MADGCSPFAVVGGGEWNEVVMFWGTGVLVLAPRPTSHPQEINTPQPDHAAACAVRIISITWLFAGTRPLLTTFSSITIAGVLITP